jgi:ATP-dependent Clp protease ATP-binding subunit ClpX
VRSIPTLLPKEIEAHIHACGYVGQEKAVRAISLGAYRHTARLRRIYLQGGKRETLPPKTNLLFVGPTGCGKTYLVEILFRDILKLPTVVVDMTGFSETGYVGQDVNSILTRLLYAADMNIALAAVGVVCLDEFDKLASGQNNAVFSGAGTTKDVSGLGVQRELLKMLESIEMPVPLEYTHSDYAPKAVISTQDIGFIACGAFSGLKGAIELDGKEHIGFGRDPLSGDMNRIAVSYSEDEVELSKNFMNYGFLPELMGRFKRIVPFNDPRAALRDPQRTAPRAVQERVHAGGQGAGGERGGAFTRGRGKPQEGDGSPRPGIVLHPAPGRGGLRGVLRYVVQAREPSRGRGQGCLRAVLSRGRRRGSTLCGCRLPSGQGFRAASRTRAFLES